VKSLESALTVRAQILSAFEAAELETDEERRRAWLTFVVVGAGPTGVEMAGQIGELARDTLRRDFRDMDPRAGRVLLVETADRVLTTFPVSLSERAARSLEHLGVTPLLSHTVVDIDDHSVTVEAHSGQERIPARTVIWSLLFRRWSPKPSTSTTRIIRCTARERSTVASPAPQNSNRCRENILRRDGRYRRSPEAAPPVLRR